MIYDGRDELIQILNRAGFATKEAAIAELTLFAHPNTVAESDNKAIFRVIRNFNSRGKIIPHMNNTQAMACDNTAPQDVFRWAVGGVSGKDIQFNHIYSKSDDIEIYTALPNICVTPSFLAKLTDQDKGVTELLKYRVYDQYGFLPNGEKPPQKPFGYDQLKWREYCPVVGKLEDLYRFRMKECPKNRATISARTLGWFFSSYLPDRDL